MPKVMTIAVDCTGPSLVFDHWGNELPDYEIEERMERVQATIVRLRHGRHEPADERASESPKY